MRTLSFFLGCITPNRYPGIEVATRYTLDRLGVELCCLEGTSCCPAPGVFRSFDKLTWLVIAARNLCLSEEEGLDILTVCNGCFGSLSDANHILKEDNTLRDKVNQHLSIINKEFKGNIEVRHIAEYLYHEIGVKRIHKEVTRELDNLRVAVHYGCHLIRPSKERKLGSVENPNFLDELVEATGAKSVEYADKLACCGAGGGVRTAVLDNSLKLAQRKLMNIKAAKADCIVDVCPFCHLQLDTGQTEIMKKFGNSYSIPVLHYTQLLGIAMNFGVEELGIQMNAIINDELLIKLRGEQA